MSWTVADLMTRDVVTVSSTSSYDACLRTMRMHGVGALPVVNDRAVVGIVTMTDLLLKVDRPSERARYADVPSSDGKPKRLTAASLMTPRVIMVMPDTPLSVVVRQMFQHRINRIPVVDPSGRLVGIVSRSDVLRMFLRSDIAIRREVARTVVGDMPFIGEGTVLAEVEDGLVTLKGEVEPGTLTDVLLRLVASVPGVVGVKNALSVKRRGASIT